MGKATGKTLADAVQAINVLWEETQRNASYQNKCDDWKKLRKGKRPKKAKELYDEIMKEYYFPPMDPELSLEENLKELIETEQAQNEALYNARIAGEKRNIEEGYEYSSKATEQFLKKYVWNDLFFRVIGYSPISLRVNISDKKVRKLKIIDPRKTIKARRMRVDLNLEYPKKMVLDKLGQLIDKCHGLVEITNMLMGPPDKNDHFILEDKNSGNGDFFKIKRSKAPKDSYRTGKSVGESQDLKEADDPDISSKKHLVKVFRVRKKGRSSKENEENDESGSFGFSVGDLTDTYDSDSLSGNGLTDGWDQGKLDTIRSRLKKGETVAKEEWVDVLNAILPVIMKEEVYQSIKGNTSLQALLGQDTVVLLDKVMDDRGRMTVAMTEQLNRRILEAFYPQQIRKTHKSQDSGNGILLKNYPAMNLIDGEEDVCVIPNSRFRMDKFNQSFKFVESDLRGNINAVLKKAMNEILGCKWDSGELDALRKKERAASRRKDKVTKKEWVEALNRILSKRLPRQAYEKVQGKSTLRKKLKIDVQEILKKILARPEQTVSDRELEYLNRKILEMAFPANIKKRHLDYLSRQDLKKPQSNE
jgi:hypothetical protein